MEKGESAGAVFLGVTIDCVTRTLSLPSKKLRELLDFIESWDDRRKVTKLEVQRMVGKLNWAARVIRGGRTFMRALIDLVSRARESHHHVRISAAARMDLLWWKCGLPVFNGTCQFKCDVPLPSFCFATDACESGGGGYLYSDWFYSSWVVDYPDMINEHINVLELFTVVLALRRWGSALLNSHVKIISDNMATVAALRKATSRSGSLMPLIREIYWICVQFNITISSAHIPGKLNILADRVSRLVSCSEAYDARLLLANFTSGIVACKTHMSWFAFCFLQGAWTPTSPSFVERQRLLNDLR